MSQLLKMLLGPLKEVEPISLLSSPQTNQFSGDPTCYFSSPTLNPVTRGLKEGEPKQPPCPCAVPAVQPLSSAHGAPVEASAPRPPPPRAGSRAPAKAPPAPACGPLPSLALGGAATPRPSPWSPLAAEWGLRKGRSVPRGAEAAFAPAPAPCGSSVSE